MKICLAIGDRECEEFIQKSLEKLIDTIQKKSLNELDIKIKNLYASSSTNEEKKIKKREILKEFFNGDAFLSLLSYTTLQIVEQSNITHLEFIDATYRESVVSRCKDSKVDVLLLSEMLQGNVLFQTLCQQLRVSYPDLRIIVIGGEHQKGDEFLKHLVEKGIYDIVYGKALNVVDLIRNVFRPNNYQQANSYYFTPQQLQPETLGGEHVKKEITQTLKIQQPPIEQETKQKKNVFTKTKEQPPIENSNDTDLFLSEENHPTEYIDPDSGEVDGLIAYPYEIQPVLINDLKQKTSYIIHPNGTKTVSTVLPNLPFTENEQAYIKYIDLLKQFSGDVVHHEIAKIPNFVKISKTLLFTSSLHGVGCSTIAFNMACMFAQTGKNVLFIDSNFGTTAMFDRLNFPKNIGITLEDLIKTPQREKEILNKQLLVAYSQGKDMKRFSSLPNTLSYITWTNQTSSDLTWITNNIQALDELFQRLSNNYDYLIIDSTLLFMNDIYNYLYKSADYIIPVVNQDEYVTRQTIHQLKYYEQFHISSKIRILINCFENISLIGIKFFQENFRNSFCYSIPNDHIGFIKSNYLKIPYVSYRGAKRKVIKSYQHFMSELI